MLKNYCCYFIILFLISTTTIFAQKASSNSPVCEGTNLQLSAEVGTKYAWKGPNSFNSDQQNPLISKASLANTGVYSVTIINDSKTSLLTVDVTVNKLPLIITGTTGQMDGSYLYVGTYSGGDKLVKILWKGPNGFSSTETYNYIQDVTSKNFGVYTIEGTGLNGCTNTATMTFNPTDPCFFNLEIAGLGSTSPSTKTASGVICSEAKQMYISNPPTTANYTWIKDSKDLKINKSSITVNESGRYECIIQTQGCTYRYNAVVEKRPSFDINLERFGVQQAGLGYTFSSPFQLCKNGGEIELFARITGGNPNEYQWFKDGQPIVSAITNTYKITEAGAYTVKAKEVSGCTGISKPAIVEARDKLIMKFTHPFLSTKGDTISFCTNTPWGVLTTTNTINGFSGSQTQWYKDGKSILEETYPNLVLSNKSEGNYQLKMKQGSCSFESQVITLNLNKKIVYKPQITLDSNYNCQSGYFDFSIRLPFYNDRPKYEWFKNGQKINLGLSYYTPYLPDWGVGKYSFKYTETTGCIYDSDVIDISSIRGKKSGNPPPPTVDYPNYKNPITYCEGTSVLLRAFSNATGTYTWFKDGISVGTSRDGSYLITESGNYTYIFNDCFGRLSDPLKITIQSVTKPTITREDCDNSGVTLATKVVPDLKYQWLQNGNVLKDENKSFIKANSSGNYSIITTDNNQCFTESEKTSVTKESLTLPTQFSICKGGTLSFWTKKPIEGIYTWTGPNNFNSTEGEPTVKSIDSLKVGTYKLTVRTLSGCLLTASTEVKLKAQQVLSSQEIATIPSICEGNKSFTINALIRNYSQYLWTGPNTFSSTERKPILTNITKKNEGIYSITITDTDGCKINGTMAVVIRNDTNKILERYRTESYPCRGQNSYEINLNLPNYVNYSWMGPNGFKATSTNVTLTKISSKQAGIYTAILTNVDGCKFSATTKVIVQDPPSLILPKTLLGCENAPLQFYPKSKLTDSTEIFDKLGVSGPNNFKGQYFLDIDKLTTSKEGFYVFTAYTSSCEVTDSVNVKIDKSGNCKAIVLDKLIAYEGICSSATVEIPFTTIGNFGTGTKYTVYAKYNETGEVINLGTFTKSPAKVKFDYIYAWLGFTYYIKASDNTQSLNSPQVSTKEGTPYTQIYGNSVACKQSNLYLSYNSNYNKLSNFQWTLDGKDVEGESNDFIVAKKSGRYDVRFDLNGCSYKSYPSYDQAQGQSGYEVQVQGKDVKIGTIEKPEIYSQYSRSPLSFCSGSSFMLNSYFRSSLDSSLSLQYSWKRNGETINAISFYNVTTNKSGDYTLEITNGTCSVKSEPFTVIATDNVKANVSLRTNLSYNYNNGYQICKGTPAYLYYTNYDYKNTEELRQQEVIDLSKKGIIVQWYRNGILLPNAKNPAIKIIEDGSYTLRIQEGECLRYSDNFNISFKRQTSKMSYNNLQACEGQGVYLSNYFNMTSSFYDENNKVINLRTQVREWLKDGKTYQKDSVNNNYYYSQYIYPTESGNFYQIGKMTYEDGSSCEYISDTVQVKIGNPEIALTSYFTSLISCSDSVQLYYGYVNDSRAISNIWKKDGLVLKNQDNSSIYVKESGKYTLETNFKGGCMATGKPIDVKMGQFSVIVPTEISICENQKTDIYANVNNTQNYYGGHGFIEDSTLRYTYQWQKNGVDILNEKGSYLLNISEPGNYSVKTKFKNCQAVSNNTLISLNNVPNAISPQDSARFCPKNTVELKTSTEKGLAYEWYKNKIILTNEKNSNLKINEAGTYRALLNRNGCYGYTKPVVGYEKLVLPTAKLSDSLQVYYGDSVKVKVNLTGDAPWILKISDGRDFTASTSPYTLGFRPLSTSSFTVQEVKNICGVGTVSGKAKIEVIILGKEEEATTFVNVFPSPTYSICQIEISTPKPEKLCIMLMDMMGRVLIEQSTKNSQIIHKEQLDLSNYPTGNYILNMKLGEKIISRKIIKTSE
jgi:Secretion system C-terminal sorting domain